MPSKLQALFTAAILLTAVSAVHAEGLGAHPPLFLVEAEYALEAGDTARTIELLNKRYKRLRAPQNRIRGLAALCQAHLQEQNYRRAFRPCVDAADMKQADWSDFNNRGVLELNLGQFSHALASFERARTLNPGSEDVSDNLARARAIIDNELISSAH